jgi:quercetin dioxygenase-like cupin family protein
MHRRSSALLLVAVLGLVATQRVSAQNADSAHVMAAVIASQITWGPIDVPGFSPGLKIAVIQGDPAGTGPYTLRLSLPDGYRFPPHWHPNDENLTVITGTFMLAMGDRADESKLVTYQPGDYLLLPGTKPHFGGVKGATVVQLHGQGPFTINVVKPSM